MMVRCIFILLTGLCWPLFLFGQNLPNSQLIRAIQKVKPAFVSVGGGSGIIISADGYILTNHHVARGIADWLVVRPGGKVYRADLVGYDSVGDIALLKIRGEKNLPFVPLGDSDKIRPGQPIFALGNPWGFAGFRGHPTVTFGIISAIHRYQGGYGDCFQIDAPINPGNSGGPTFDLRGRLLGINGQIRPRFGRRTFSGVGLAIPINQIKNFLPLLKKGGEVGHGTLPKGLKFASGPSPKGGVAVEEGTLEGSGQWKRGDILLSIAGLKPSSHNRVQGIVSTFPAGTSLICKVLRGKKVIQFSLAIDKVPTYGECLARGIPFRFSSPPQPYIGLDYGEAIKKGVEIIGVIEDSPSDKAGILAGDILLTFQGKSAEDKWNLRSLLSGSRFGDKLTLKILRKNTQKTFTLTIGSTAHFPIKRYKSKITPHSGSPSKTPTNPTTPSTPPGPSTPTPRGELTVEALGLVLGEMDEDSDDEGIPLEDVKKNSFAQKKGFQKGDLVVKLNGEELEDSYDLENKIRFANQRKKLKFKILRKVRDRKGKTKKVFLTIEFFWKEK